MKLFKDFAFGAAYLVSGIYSLGFSMVLTGTTRAVSGNTAFRASVRHMSEKQARYGTTTFVG
jgi:hypothetical protein